MTQATPERIAEALELLAKYEDVAEDSLHRSWEWTENDWYIYELKQRKKTRDLMMAMNPGMFLMHYYFWEVLIVFTLVVLWFLALGKYLGQ